MKVTPEMLIFLAGKMGLPNPIISQYPDTEPRCYLRWSDGVTNVFWPQKDRIQFADVVLWVAMNELAPCMTSKHASALYEDGEEAVMLHDNTPAGIMEATVVAVARALGWEDV